MESGLILVKDLPAEKSQSSFGGLRTSKKAVNVLRGELLIAIPGDKLVLRNDGGRPHNYRLARDATVSLRAEPDDFAPLNPREFALLEAVKLCHIRYSIFLSCGKLDWGLSLRKGSEVFVIVNPEAPKSAWVYSKAVVRCFGDLVGQRGIFFGVEIMEEAFYGQGTTGGVFQGKRYFHCRDNCGFFVALDMLSPRREGSHTAEDEGMKEEEGIFEDLKHELEQAEKKIKLRHKAQKERLEQQLAQSQQAEQSLKIQLAQATKDVEDLRETLAQTEKNLQESVQAKDDLQRQVAQLSEEKQMELWNMPRTDIQLVTEIGRGGWGTVLKGTFRGQSVAVKQLHPNILSKDNVQRLRREVRMMAQVRHPNLLLFIAAVFDDEVERLKSPPLIVMLHLL